MKTWRIALILLMLALLVVVPVYAQETTEVPATTEQAPEAQPIAGAVETTPSDNQAPGLPAGVLLIGLGAAAAVGGLSLLRENYKAPTGK